MKLGMKTVPAKKFLVVKHTRSEILLVKSVKMPLVMKLG
jgi:hypothetical protein